jgi:transcriptional regulator with XRE-family HTH domain
VIKEMRDYIEIGKRLRQLRKHFNLRQEDFASRIKIHQSTLALFESGERNLKDIYVKIICDEFSCNENWLLDGKGNMITTNKSISLDEYAKLYNLSKLESDIIKTYMEIKEETRKEIIQKFATTFLQSNKINFGPDILVHDKDSIYSVDVKSKKVE